MSRSRFGWWGAELDDADFARALATLGFVGARSDQYQRFPPLESSEQLSSDIKQAFSGGRAVAWEFSVEPETLAGMDHRLSAGELAQIWQAKLDSGSLEIHSNAYTDAILPWWVETLSRGELDLNSIYVRMSSDKASIQWHWPVRIGLLDDPTSQQLAQSFRETRWGTSLAKVETLGPHSEPCDILILPDTTRTSLLALLSLTYRIRASCVVVLGGFGENWERAQSLLSALLAQVDAEGICVASVPPEQRSEWFHEFIEQLSHDESLDFAFRMVAHWLDLPAPFLMASAVLVHDARLSVFIERLSNRIDQLPDDARLFIPEDAARLLGISFGAISARVLAKDLLLQAQNYAFQSESGEATGAERLVDAVEESLQRATPGALRWIQGQVFALRSEGQPERLARAFYAGAQHVLTIRIGPSDEDWLTPPLEAVFPEDKLDWEEDTHRLQVVFSEPNHAPDPQTATIVLPRFGSSSTCQFIFRTLSDVTSFKGRIIVLYRNRVLQTALLQGLAVSATTEAPEAMSLSLDIEGMIRPQLFGLDARQDFDLAFVANHSNNQELGLTTIAEEYATFRSVQTLLPYIDGVKEKLIEVVHKPEAFSDGLDSEANHVLLRELAIMGSRLYSGMIENQIGGGRLHGIRRIQLIAAVEDYLPLEFFYDRPRPKSTARLCPDAISALAGNKCVHCEGTENPRDFVCPLGFFGLSRVIERHYVDPKWQQTLAGRDFAIRSEPVPGRKTLQILDGAVYAASERVDKGVAGEIDRVYQALDKVTGQKTILVEDWDAWVQAVEQQKPCLLVLLPHTLSEGPFKIKLEIGEDEQLFVNDIDESYIGVSAPHAGPVVFLLGCETLDAKDVLAGPASHFRDEGAAIVLSTLTPVLGRHVGPVTEALVKELEYLQANAAEISFGEALLNIRRRVLAQGLPMVLSVLAYGDADWQLGIKNA